MEVIKNEFTTYVWCLSIFGDDQILTGHYGHGFINAWKYTRPQTLQHIRRYDSGDEIFVWDIIPYSKDKFIFSGRYARGYIRTLIRRWDLSSGINSRDIGTIDIVDYDPTYVMLPNDLLVIAEIFRVEGRWEWKSFNVWDVDSLACIYKDQQMSQFRVSEAVASQGFLISASFHSGRLYIWQIDRSICKLISEIETFDGVTVMATLPTGEIVTSGNGTLNFYKISSDQDITIHHCKTINVNYVIDRINPLEGSKFLTITDDLENSVSSMMLWDFEPQYYDVISETICLTGETAKYINFNEIIISARESVMFIHDYDQIIIVEFDEGIFRGSSGIAEVIKNARIISQASRRRTNRNNVFCKLPIEINMKIVALTCDYYTKESQKKVIERIVENYF